MDWPKMGVPGYTWPMRRLGLLGLALLTSMGWSGVAHAEESSYLGNVWQTHFDSPLGEGHASTAKKGVVLGLLGTGLVASGFGVIKLFQASAIESDRQALLAPNGGQNCVTPQGCAELQQLKTDYRSALDTGAAALVVGAAANAVAVGVLMLWPNANVGGGCDIAPGGSQRYGAGEHTLA